MGLMEVSMNLFKKLLLFLLVFHCLTESVKADWVNDYFNRNTFIGVFGGAFGLVASFGWFATYRTLQNTKKALEDSNKQLAGANNTVDQYKNKCMTNEDELYRKDGLNLILQNKVLNEAGLYSRMKYEKDNEIKKIRNEKDNEIRKKNFQIDIQARRIQFLEDRNQSVHQENNGLREKIKGLCVALNESVATNASLQAFYFSHTMPKKPANNRRNTNQANQR